MYWYFIIMILFGSNMHADISKIRVLPSGISVTFEVLEKIIEIEEKQISRRKRKKKQEEKVEIPQKMIKFSKFIRVINSLETTENNKKDIVALAFYDEQDELISQEIITNSTKPSPKHIFFIDRNTGKNFQGKLDIYYIPDDTSYFKIGVFDKKKIVTVATHPDFDEDDKIKISNYNKISPKQSIMLQIELLGNYQKIDTRVVPFFFVR